MGLRYRHAMNLAHAAVAACVALGACVDGPRSTSPVASALELSRALVPLDRFGIGHGGRANACRAPEYRQFDFWVGDRSSRRREHHLVRARAGGTRRSRCQQTSAFAERQTQNALAL